MPPKKSDAKAKPAPAKNQQKTSANSSKNSSGNSDAGKSAKKSGTPAPVKDSRASGKPDANKQSVAKPQTKEADPKQQAVVPPPGNNSKPPSLPAPTSEYLPPENNRVTSYDDAGFPVVNERVPSFTEMTPFPGSNPNSLEEEKLMPENNQLTDRSKLLDEEDAYRKSGSSYPAESHHRSSERYGLRPAPGQSLGVGDRRNCQQGSDASYIKPCGDLTESEKNFTSNYINKLFDAHRDSQPRNQKETGNLEVLGIRRYTKVFDSQVDDYGHGPSYRRNVDDHNLEWNSVFGVKVFLALSIIHFCQSAIFEVPQIRRCLVTAIPVLQLDWIIVIPILVIILVSIVSVINCWGQSCPTNIIGVLIFVIAWTTIWMIAGLRWVDIVRYLLVNLGSYCFSMMMTILLHPQFDLRGATIYYLAAVIVSLQVGLSVALAKFGYIGDDTWNYVGTILCISTFFATIIFLYICFDVSEMLNGNRPIAWPHQWLFGVLSVYQDFIWMIWEGLQLILYLFPFTYCKDGENTVWKRWKCCRHNNNYYYHFRSNNL